MYQTYIVLVIYTQTSGMNVTTQAKRLKKEI